MRQNIKNATAGLLLRILALFPDHLPIVYKISLLIAGLIIVCSATLSSVLVYDQGRIMEDQINDLGNTVVTHLARAAREPLLAEDKLAMGVLVSSLVAGESVIGTEIFSPEGESIVKAGISPFAYESLQPGFSPGDMIAGAGKNQRWSWHLSFSEKHKVNVVSFVSPIIFNDLTAGYAMVTFSQQALDLSKEKALISIAVATVIIMILGIILAHHLSKHISKPVDHFMEAIEAFDSGNYHFRFNDRRRNEVGQLMNAFDRMADGMVQKIQVEKALERYLSPQIARQVLSNFDSIKLGGKRISGSVLFADIVGFTKISERLAPEELAEILNRFFSLITRACEVNTGVVDKYMGDCVMLVFGTPEEDEEHAFHAALCGLLIRKLVEHENGIREKAGLFPIKFRIGINSGSMLAGNMGSKEKMEYTVVGDSVNLASRLCTIATADQIVVSNEFYNQKYIRQRVIARAHIPMQLRGVEEMVATFLVKDLAADYKEILARQFQSVIDSDFS
ncbi:MAG: HAMP domain-containing protein [Proteobacteria bacterium]|nr:HAMP domain-containing protein [Pseudomonadota bacterium]MBU1739656.1 HAMP domain-containing protein [Pseudomonadota bacterium]